MKSIFVLIILVIVGYWLYTFYQQNPDDLPSLVHIQKGAVSTPIPTLITPTPRPVAPKLDSIPVVKGETLTHARVKTIHADSLLFVCDQGLVKVAYDRLPPAFAAYYQPLAPTPTPVTTPDPNAPPTPTPTPAPTSIHVRQRTPEEEAAALDSFARSKAALESDIAHDQDVIDRYYSQSTYNNSGVITEQEFTNAKIDLDARNAQLQVLLGTGP
jgi:hypothetical protein